MKPEISREESIKLIAGRIEDEFRRHANSEFPKIAARKIHEQWTEYYTEQLSAKNTEIEKLNTIIDELREQKVQLQDGLKASQQEFSELQNVSIELFNLAHNSGNIEDKIKANELYNKIKP